MQTGDNNIHQLALPVRRETNLISLAFSEIQGLCQMWGNSLIVSLKSRLHKNGLHIKKNTWAL